MKVNGFLNLSFVYELLFCLTTFSSAAKADDADFPWLLRVSYQVGVEGSKIVDDYRVNLDNVMKSVHNLSEYIEKSEIKKYPYELAGQVLELTYLLIPIKLNRLKTSKNVIVSYQVIHKTDRGNGDDNEVCILNYPHKLESGHSLISSKPNQNDFSPSTRIMTEKGLALVANFSIEFFGKKEVNSSRLVTSLLQTNIAGRQNSVKIPMVSSVQDSRVVFENYRIGISLSHLVSAWEFIQQKLNEEIKESKDCNFNPNIDEIEEGIRLHEEGV